MPVERRLEAQLELVRIVRLDEELLVLAAQELVQLGGLRREPVEQDAERRLPARARNGSVARTPRREPPDRAFGRIDRPPEGARSPPQSALDPYADSNAEVQPAREWSYSIHGAAGRGPPSCTRVRRRARGGCALPGRSPRSRAADARRVLGADRPCLPSPDARRAGRALGRPSERRRRRPTRLRSEEAEPPSPFAKPSSGLDNRRRYVRVPVRDARAPPPSALPGSDQRPRGDGRDRVAVALLDITTAC